MSSFYTPPDCDICGEAAKPCFCKQCYESALSAGQEEQQPTDYKERYFELLKAVNDYLECDTASQSHKAMDKLYELATAMGRSDD